MADATVDTTRNQRICDIEGCGRALKCKGLCGMHYQRRRLTGDLGPADAYEIRTTCEIEGCDRPHRRNGMCDMHSARVANHGSPHLAPTYAPEMVARVRELYEAGMSQDEVAAALDTSQKVIFRLMRKHGIPRRAQVPRDQRGEKGHGYNPESTNYTTLHNRVEAARGRPSECSACGTTDPLKRYDWANLTGNYRDVNDFARMCRSCHRKFDARRRRETGQLTGIPR